MHKLPNVNSFCIRNNRKGILAKIMTKSDIDVLVMTLIKLNRVENTLITLDDKSFK